jgi:MaoC like domain
MIDNLADLCGWESCDGWTWAERDVILYALAVGATPEHDLEYLYERNGPRVLDLFCTLPLSSPWSVQLLSELDRPALFFGETFSIARPMAPSGTAQCVARVTAVWDTGQSAFVEVESGVASSGMAIATARSLLYLPGAGGFGGPPPPPTMRTQHGWDDAPTSPDILPISGKVKTRPEQAVLFRTIGDYLHRARLLRADVHIDSATAASLGLAAPILPGTCVMGIAARVLAAPFERAGQALRAVSVRYLDVAYPGDVLIVRIGREAGALTAFAVHEKGGRLIMAGTAEFD